MEKSHSDSKFDDLDQLCASIADLRHTNHALIQRYRLIQEAEAALKDAVSKKYGGPIASDQVIERKVQDRLALLGSPRKPRSVIGQAMKQRLTFTDKLALTKAMVEDFAKQQRERVSLDDINAWLDQPRQKGQQDVRDLLKVRGIHVSQVRWFEVGPLGDRKKMGLLPKSAYDTKGAGAKSTIDVRKWKAHLDRIPSARSGNERGVRL
jgi:hypothetical protein